MMKKSENMTFLVLACSALLFASCSGDRIYYANRPDPVGEIVKTYGQPQRVESRADGSEKMIFYVHDPMGSGYLERYFIIKDGKVVDGGVR
jgi:hypothetical protein